MLWVRDLLLWVTLPSLPVCLTGGPLLGVWTDHPGSPRPGGAQPGGEKQGPGRGRGGGQWAGRCGTQVSTGPPCAWDSENSFLVTQRGCDLCGRVQIRRKGERRKQQSPPKQNKIKKKPNKKVTAAGPVIGKLRQEDPVTLKPAWATWWDFSGVPDWPCEGGPVSLSVCLFTV